MVSVFVRVNSNFGLQDQRYLLSLVRFEKASFLFLRVPTFLIPRAGSEMGDITESIDAGTNRTVNKISAFEPISFQLTSGLRRDWNP